MGHCINILTHCDEEQYFSAIKELYLTFKNRASYIEDGPTATFQMLHFIFIFFLNYKY
jgi:hypothetical protein